VSIPPEVVLKVARLAHLELTPAEAGRLSGQLGAILGHIAQLDELDCSGVSPDPGHFARLAPLRDDETAPSLSRDTVLDQAPAADAGLFRVPPVL
jgi:aspartyl-tRNA(Asn)/glutamyl-tRNA(Gln) amidotransferase subunit C